MSRNRTLYLSELLSRYKEDNLLSLTRCKIIIFISNDIYGTDYGYIDQAIKELYATDLWNSQVKQWHIISQKIRITIIK